MQMDEFWVAKRDMVLAGAKVSIGQIIQPAGSRHDHLIFVAGSRWVYLLQGGDPVPCGSDGCSAEFDTLGNLQRHREVVHKPVRDEREVAKARSRRSTQVAE